MPGKVNRGGLKILGTLVDGTGDPSLTIDSTTKEVGSAIGTIGPAGADGKSVLSGSSVPSPAIGTNGDFYINTSTWDMYGPKTGGVWTLSTSLIGPIGDPGSDGANGANGNSVLSGIGVPGLGTGVNGDFYIDLSNYDIYGPKTGGVWGSPTSLVGPSSIISPGTEGDILYYNGSAWVSLPRGTNGQALYSTATSIQWDTPTINGIPIGGTLNQVLAKQSGTDFDADWTTLSLSLFPGITALDADINILAGAAAAGISSAEFITLNGVNSNIQSQLDGKQSNLLAHNALWVGNISGNATQLSPGSNGTYLGIVAGSPTWTTVNAGHVIQNNSIPLTQRTNLNFSSNFIVTDDAGNNQTDVDVVASISDGDKGDITVSSSGAVWTIDTDINKAWTGTHSFESGDFQLFNPANTFKYIFATSAITGDRTITIPQMGGNANLVVGSIGNAQIPVGSSVNGIVTSSSNLTFSGTALVVSSGTISTTVSTITAGGTFNPSSGSTSYTGLTINPTFSTTGSYSGSSVGYLYSPTRTSVTGLTEYAIRTDGGGVLFANSSSDVITTTSRLDVRGISGSGLFRLASSANTTRLTVSDNGTFGLTSDMTGNAGAVSSTFAASINANANAGVYTQLHVTPTSINTSGTFNGAVYGVRYNITPSSTVSNGATFYVLGGSGGLVQASGTSNYIGVYINPTYNTTGTHTGGTAVGFDYSPTLTSLTGLTHYAFRSSSGQVLFTGNQHTAFQSTGTWTATATNQFHAQINPTITGTGTIGDTSIGLLINPAFTAGVGGQTGVALDVAPTTTGAYIGLRLRGPASLATNFFISATDNASANIFRVSETGNLTLAPKTLGTDGLGIVNYNTGVSLWAWRSTQMSIGTTGSAITVTRGNSTSGDVLTTNGSGGVLETNLPAFVNRGNLLKGTWATTTGQTDGVSEFVSLVPNFTTAILAHASGATLTDFNTLSLRAVYNLTAANTADAKVINIAPTVTSAMGDFHGIYYNPSVTSISGNHIAFENTSGQLRFGAVTNDDTKTRILAIDDTTGQVFYRTAASLGGGSIGGSTGSVDNAVLRADGTGGATLQSSALIVDDTCQIQLGTASTGNAIREITAVGSQANIIVRIEAKGSGYTEIASGGAVGGVIAGDTLNSTYLVTSSTNTVDTVFSIQSSGGVTPAAGIGTGINFQTRTSGVNDEIGAEIQSVATNVGVGTEAFDLVFKTMTGGAAATEKLRVASTGTVTIGNTATFSTTGGAAGFIFDNATSRVIHYGGLANLDLNNGAAVLTAANSNFPRIVSSTALTNTTANVRIVHETSGTPATGIAAGLVFEVETAAGNNESGATIEAVTTNVGSGAEEFDLVFKTMTGGAAPTESFRIKSYKALGIPSIAADPSSPVDADMWYNTTSDQLKARINGATVALGAGGGVTNSAINTELMMSDGTNAISSGLLMTSVGQSLSFGTSSTAGTDRAITAVGSGTDIGMTFSAKGSGAITLNSTGSSGTVIAAVGNAFAVNANNSSNNTMATILQLNKNTTGTPGVGHGVAIDFNIETTAGLEEKMATVGAVSTNVGSGTEAADLVIRLMSAGADSEKFRFKSSGVLNIATVPANDDALTDILVRDGASGDVKYRSAASLGGGGGLTFSQVYRISTLRL